MPDLVTIPNVPLVSTGTYRLASGEHTFTAADLLAAVAALDDPAVRTPVLKLGHDGPLTSDQPTIGKVEAMRLSEDGQTLYGDLVGVPKWLADILPTAYPRRSIEANLGVKSATGRKHRMVLTALSLLGTTLPGVATLDDLRHLYTAESVPEFIEAGEPICAMLPSMATTPDPPTPRISAAVEIEDVRRAYYDALDSARSFWWIRAIRLDPQDLIVDDDEGTLYRVPWSVGKDGPEFGDPVPVRIEYIDTPEPVRASVGGAIMAAYETRAESRPDERSNMDPKDIRERLGLAEDATDDEVLARLDELAAAGEPVPEAEAEAEALAPEPVAASAQADTVTVDRETFESLRAGAEAGREARAEQERQHRESLVTAAVEDGRIAPARKDAWLKRLAADPAEAEVLAGLEKGLIPVDEVGGAPATSDNEDAEMALIRAGFGIDGKDG